MPDEPFKHLPLTLPLLSPYEIYCLVHDLWTFLKDTDDAAAAADPAPADGRRRFPPVQPYFERLRVIAAHKFPGQLFVRLFRPIRAS